MRHGWSDVNLAAGGWSHYSRLQLEYSLLERTAEGELIPMAQEMGMGVMPWSPLKHGLLSGKFRRPRKWARVCACETFQAGRSEKPM
jgi:aryl-alcohol dehydrogenase-like predicted oxidoreductase